MTTKVLRAEFIKSAPKLEDAPDFGGLAEFVLVGRSNVGKSSFINAMLGRKNLAQTSNTPGKTRLINYYRFAIEEEPTAWEAAFADLPGYGYAKVSKTEQQRWQKHLEEFLTKREPIRLILQLIDSRHPPQTSDIQMFEWLAHHELPQVIVLTKTDKTTVREVSTHTKAVMKALQIGEESIIPFSAERPVNRDMVWQLLRTCDEA